MAEQIVNRTVPRTDARAKVTGTAASGILSRTFVQLVPGIVSDRSALKAALDQIARLGLGGAELNIVNPDEFDLDTLEAELAARELTMSAYATGGDANANGLSISAPDDDLRRRSVERCKRYIEVASRFRSSIILGFMKGGPGGDVPARRRLLVESLREIAPVADSLGVAVQLEATNHYEAACAVTVAETVGLAEESGKQAVRVLPDTYHMNIEEPDMAATLVRFAGSYVNVHLSDNNRYFPGFGGIDFGRVLAVLGALGYEGSFGIEGRACGSLEDDIRRAAACVAEAAERAAASAFAGP